MHLVINVKNVDFSCRLLMHAFQFLSESYPKCPWVRIFAHNGTQGLARDGQPLRQEVVHYPYNSTTFAQVQLYCYIKTILIYQIV